MKQNQNESDLRSRHPSAGSRKAERRAHGKPANQPNQNQIVCEKSDKTEAFQRRQEGAAISRRLHFSGASKGAPRTTSNADSGWFFGSKSLHRRTRLRCQLSSCLLQQASNKSL